MRESVIRLPGVLGVKSWLLQGIDNPENKERARLVPAAAVKPALQVVGTIIGLKVFVAGLVSSWLNLAA